MTTSPDNWSRMWEIYEAALAKPSSERGSFVAQACEANPELRAKIDKMLQQDHPGEGFLDAPVEPVSPGRSKRFSRIFGETIQELDFTLQCPHVVHGWTLNKRNGVCSDGQSTSAAARNPSLPSDNDRIRGGYDRRGIPGTIWDMPVVCPPIGTAT